jgi:ssDNA-binding Zn-finger/Zn-ribbon topoisomerase 1
MQKYTAIIVALGDVPCPKCGARLLERTTRRGKKFLWL